MHAWPPVLNGISLGILLTSTVAEATLGHDLGDHVQLAQIDLDVLQTICVLAQRPGRAPSSATRVKIESETNEHTCFKGCHVKAKVISLDWHVLSEEEGMRK